MAYTIINTYRHIILSNISWNLKLITRHYTVQVLNSRQTVHLLLDGWSHKCCEPPRHHLKYLNLPYRVQRYSLTFPSRWCNYVSCNVFIFPTGLLGTGSTSSKHPASIFTVQ